MDRATSISIILGLPLILFIAIAFAAWRMQRMKIRRKIFTHSKRSIRVYLGFSAVVISVAYLPIVIALLNLQKLAPLQARDYSELMLISIVGCGFAAWGSLPPFLEYAFIDQGRIYWFPAIGTSRMVEIDEVLDATLAKGPNSIGVALKTSRSSIYIKASLEQEFWNSILRLRPYFPFSPTVKKTLKLAS
ncbi:hypothetical protein [Roseateles sp. YR242]|uniref:hypothetical protein n=1 Tax=Roseateles sp. YR242 TaxID=1855305 RepID=UPI00116062D5|nr:hypothetical protein [Roseateles sp. YR242]